MGKNAPKAPDPVKTAGAQTAQNIGTAIAQQSMGSVNQRTPYGSLTYKQTGTQKWRDPSSGKTYKIPKYTATQTLSAPQQRILDKNSITQENLAQTGADQSARLDDLLNEDFNPTEGVGDLRTTYNTDFSEDRQRVEDAIFGRMQPVLDRSREALEARLASQGIDIGSQAYSTAMGDQGRNENDARLAAIMAGGGEQSRLVGLEAQRANFENNARTQGISENYASRSQPINEILAFASGGQVRDPNFVSTSSPGVANTDYAGIVANKYNQDIKAWQQKQANIGGLLGLGGTLGRSAIGAGWF